MLLAVFGLYLDKGGGHAVFPDFFGGERPARNVERLQLRAQVFDGAAGVDQGAESHVTADSAKTIKIGEFHNDPPPGDGAGTAK